MYQNGECVIYGVHGVCRVVGREKQTVSRKRIEYLILEPLGHPESRFYLPTASETAMGKLRAVLDAQELTALLESDEIREFAWISDENTRKQYYRELLGNTDRKSILKMVCALYRYRADQFAAGKKFHQCDENFLRDAEKLICSEVSLVLDKTTEEARNYIRQILQ